MATTNAGSSGRRSLAPLLAAAVLAASAPGVWARAETACDSLTQADVAALGFDKVQPGSPSGSRTNVSLDSTAAIMGRETECLWQTGHGSLTLILGDLDANLVKGDAIERLGHKVLASAREKIEVAAVYSGPKPVFSTLPGVGDEAWSARLTPHYFDVLSRRGLRLVRLRVSTTNGIARTPSPEQVGAVAARLLSAQGGFTSAGAAPIKGEHPWAGPGDRYTVTGAITATGSLSGTFTWRSPNAVELYPDRTEVVLANADKSAFMNLQVWNGLDRVQLMSGRLSAAKLTGVGRTARVDPLAGTGTFTVDATVGTGAERVTLRGTLDFKPVGGASR